MKPSLTQIKGGKNSGRVKEWLTALLNRVDTDYPDVEDVVIVIASAPSKEDRDECHYACKSNDLTEERKLWLLEMGKQIIFHT